MTGAGRPVRAVLFDLDGTLYHQEPLRLAMAVELAALPLRGSPGAARRTWRALGAFRRVREELRELGAAEASLERLQFEVAAARARLEVREMEATVEEWIFRRPLRYLRRCRRRGIRDLVGHLASRGVPAGVFSDYPAGEKLEALGLREGISLLACATDPGINAFKPHPKGFLWSCERWGLAPAEVLYVGDRWEVDGAGAANAGMPCAIMSRGLGRLGRRGGQFSSFSSVTGLRNAIDAGG